MAKGDICTYYQDGAWKSTKMARGNRRLRAVAGPHTREEPRLNNRRSAARWPKSAASSMPSGGWTGRSGGRTRMVTTRIRPRVSKNHSAAGFFTAQAFEPAGR